MQRPDTTTYETDQLPLKPVIWDMLARLDELEAKKAMATRIALRNSGKKRLALYDDLFAGDLSSLRGRRLPALRAGPHVNMIQRVITILANMSPIAWALRRSRRIS